MASNLDIDMALLEEALRVGEEKSKKDTVNRALREFIDLRRQKEIIASFGSIVYEPGYEYKKLRR